MLIVYREAENAWNKIFLLRQEFSLQRKMSDNCFVRFNSGADWDMHKVNLRAFKFWFQNEM